MKDHAGLGLNDRYGGWALVTGAARGIGRAFATRLANEGFDLLLVDREADETEVLAREIRETHSVRAEVVVYDLRSDELAAQAAQWAERDIGVVVNNAGLSPVDPFLDIPLEEHLATLDVNCRATLILTHVIGRKMIDRGRGAVIIMSSASAIGGTPYSAHYSATKGYGLNLGASLWSELRGSGIDVLAVCPGLTNTGPVRERGLHRTLPFFIPLSDSEPVVLGALRALGDQPVVIPTLADRVSSALTSRLLPRSWTLSLVHRSMNRLQRLRER